MTLPKKRPETFQDDKAINQIANVIRYSALVNEGGVTNCEDVARKIWEKIR